MILPPKFLPFSWKCFLLGHLGDYTIVHKYSYPSIPCINCDLDLYYDDRLGYPTLDLLEKWHLLKYWLKGSIPHHVPWRCYWCGQIKWPWKDHDCIPF